MKRLGNPRENIGVVWKRIENKRKHLFCIGTNGKHKDNTCVAWEPIEHARKTQVLRRNLWKTTRKEWFWFRTYEKTH